MRKLMLMKLPILLTLKIFYMYLVPNTYGEIVFLTQEYFLTLKLSSKHFMSRTLMKNFFFSKQKPLNN